MSRPEARSALRFSSPHKAANTRTSIWERSLTTSAYPSGATNARLRGFGIPWSGGFSQLMRPVLAFSWFHLAYTRPSVTGVSRNRLYTSSALRYSSRAAAMGWSIVGSTSLLVPAGSMPATAQNAHSTCSGEFQLTLSLRSSGTPLLLVFRLTTSSGGSWSTSASSSASFSSASLRDSRTHSANTVSSTGMPTELMCAVTLTMQCSRSTTGRRCGALLSILSCRAPSKSCKYRTSPAAYSSISADSSPNQSAACSLLSNSTPRVVLSTSCRFDRFDVPQ